MKVAVFLAGVCAADWLLLDDILEQDRQCVGLMGLKSVVFAHYAGTAQGRRFSIHIFNALLRWLADEVQRVQPSGSAAWLPPFARKVLDAAQAASPVLDASGPPQRPLAPEAIRSLVASLCTSESPPW
jgi:hypothetical protein